MTASAPKERPLPGLRRRLFHPRARPPGCTPAAGPPTLPRVHRPHLLPLSAGGSKAKAGGEEPDAAAAFAALRSERLERERAERQRQEAAVLAAAGGLPAGRRYHGGYGFGRG